MATVRQWIVPLWKLWCSAAPRCWWLIFALFSYLAETSGYLCRSLQSLERGSFTSFIKWHRRNDHTKKRRVGAVYLTDNAHLSSVRSVAWSVAHHWKKNILWHFQKEQKKKEDPAGRVKTFRPEPSGSSRDSTGTQLSSKSASHSSQPGSHGHHREPYNANKRHFGNDGTCGLDYFRVEAPWNGIFVSIQEEIQKVVWKWKHQLLHVLLQIGETGRGTVSTCTQVTATSHGRATGIIPMTHIATRITMWTDDPTETHTAAQAVTATTAPHEKGHMTSTAMTGTTGVIGLTTTGESLKPTCWFLCLQ